MRKGNRIGIAMREFETQYRSWRFGVEGVDLGAFGVEEKGIDLPISIITSHIIQKVVDVETVGE